MFFMHIKSIKSIKNRKSIKITKTRTSEQATFLPLDVFYVHENAAFFCFSSLMCVLCFLCVWNFLVKKIIKGSKIVLIASFTILLVLFRKILTHFYRVSFLSIQLLNDPFYLTYSLSPFFLIAFSILIFFIYFLQFFFLKCFNNFFTI